MRKMYTKLTMIELSVQTVIAPTFLAIEVELSLADKLVDEVSVVAI